MRALRCSHSALETLKRPPPPNPLWMPLLRRREDPALSALLSKYIVCLSVNVHLAFMEISFLFMDLSKYIGNEDAVQNSFRTYSHQPAVSTCLQPNKCRDGA